MSGPTLDDVKELLYGWPHRGMVRAGTADPFSGFLLVGARIDALASLMYESERDDRKQGKRYARFVTDFFPARYRDLGLGPILWQDLRSAPLHFMSSTGKLALADNQPEARLHLQPGEYDRIFLHWPEFLHDYESARDRMWECVQSDAGTQSRVLDALRERPPLGVLVIKQARPSNAPGVASVYGGQVTTTTLTSVQSIDVSTWNASTQRAKPSD